MIRARWAAANVPSPLNASHKLYTGAEIGITINLETNLEAIQIKNCQTEVDILKW